MIVIIIAMPKTIPSEHPSIIAKSWESALIIVSEVIMTLLHVVRRLILCQPEQFILLGAGSHFPFFIHVEEKDTDPVGQ